MIIKILVVDDEPNLRRMIVKYAAHYSIKADEAESGETALLMMESAKYDLIVMDIMMPNMDGYTAVRHIREISDVPVLMLTAKSELDDRLAGLGLGADDYMVKPFSLKELMLRIQAVVKRSKGHTPDAYTYKGIEMNITSRIVTVDDNPVILSSKEFNLLNYLIENRNRVCTRDACLEAVWGDDFVGDDRTLDTHIKVLRQRLGAYGKCILTQRGVGYRFEEIE